MAAKEYIEERFDTDWTIQISSSDLADLLESYLETKVESIKYEMIEKAFPKKHIYATKICLWFKQQLLKQ